MFENRRNLRFANSNVFHGKNGLFGGVNRHWPEANEK